MSTTTFSGPVRSGTVKEGASANLGNAVLAQSAAFVQSTTQASTGIIIPANSQIVGMKVTMTTANDGASQNLSVGTTTSADELITGAALGTAANDVLDVLALGTIVDGDLLESVGTSDVTLYVKMSAGSAGRGTFTVLYVQN